MGMDSFQESGIRCYHWVTDTSRYMKRYVRIRVNPDSTSKSSMGGLQRMRKNIRIGVKWTHEKQLHDLQDVRGSMDDHECKLTSCLAAG